MSEDHKCTCNHSRRPTDVGRRRFLATAGAATALQLDVLDFASSLFAVAEARLNNKGASLAELAKILDGKVGKSGINHRLRKICELADKLDEI